MWAAAYSASAPLGTRPCNAASRNAPRVDRPLSSIRSRCSASIVSVAGLDVPPRPLRRAPRPRANLDVAQLGNEPVRFGPQLGGQLVGRFDLAESLPDRDRSQMVPVACQHVSLGQ